jgi:hypothetical protein
MSLLYLFWFQARKSQEVDKNGTNAEDLETLYRD